MSGPPPPPPAIAPPRPAVPKKPHKPLPVPLSGEALRLKKEKVDAQRAKANAVPEKSSAPPPVLKRARTREEVQLLVERYSPLSQRLRVRVLGPSDHLGVVRDEIDDPSKTLLALDFDQTLTLVQQLNSAASEMNLRGGEETRKALREFCSQGGQVIVISAQAPTIPVLENLANELRHLDLADLFGVEEFDQTRVLDLVRSWGPNEDMSLDQLRRKLAILITLNTPRFPVDLARIGGPKKTEFSKKDYAPAEGSETPIEQVNSTESVDTVFYYLMQVDGNSKGDWSAKQTLERPKGYEELICPILCWQAYLLRTAHLRKESEDGEKDEPERLFITHEEPVTALEAGILVSIVRTIFEEASIEEKYIQQKLAQVATVISEDGLQLARKYNTFVSRYNKPQAIELYLAEHPERTRVIFIDDNSDNTWKMFEHFSTEKSSGYNVTCCWFTPPPEGKPERADPAFRENIFYLLDQYQGKLNLDGLERAPDLDKLNKFFRTRSYWVGHSPTLQDAIEFEKFLEAPSMKYIHLWRWYTHISSFASHIRAAWPNLSKPTNEQS